MLAHARSYAPWALAWLASSTACGADNSTAGSGGAGDAVATDVAAYCEATCACDPDDPEAAGCASACEGELGELRDGAPTCASPFAAYAACLAAGAGCDGATPREPACDASFAALADCAAVPDETTATGLDPDESGAGGFGSGGFGAGGA